MKIVLRIFGSLISVLNREQTLCLDEESTVKSLIQTLFEDLKLLKSPFSEASDRGGGELLILVNGRNIDTLKGLDTKLKDGDIVTLLSPFAGG